MSDIISMTSKEWRGLSKEEQDKLIANLGNVRVSIVSDVKLSEIWEKG